MRQLKHYEWQKLDLIVCWGGDDAQAVKLAHLAAVSFAALSMTLDKGDGFNRFIIQPMVLIAALAVTGRALIKVGIGAEGKEIGKQTAVAFACGYVASVASNYGLFT